MHRLRTAPPAVQSMKYTQVKEEETVSFLTNKDLEQSLSSQ